MATYLNPGTGRYKKALDSEIYVDKTRMISYLNSVVNTEQCYVCVSRPRRFGKSMAANMICAYYDREADSRELFKNTALCVESLADEEWDRYLGRFDVIKLVMTEFVGKDKDVNGFTRRLSSCILKELEEKYPDVEYDPDDLALSMDRCYRKSGIGFVIVIDEWDAIFREYKNDKEAQTGYLDYLRDWLKDKEYIALAYMTGILPIKKYGKHSALNMFYDYSMISPMQMAEYTGFTEDELRKLCSRYSMDYEQIRDWYDGYSLRRPVPVDKRADYRMGKYDNKVSVYSPLSVVNAMHTGIIENYWNKTETYEALAEYIRMDFDGLREVVAILMDGGRCRIDTGTYQNDMSSFAYRDDILTMLIHLGYLCYDTETSEVYIPNKEVLDEFKSSTKSSEWQEIFREYRLSQELLEATWAGNEDKVAELLERAHNKAANKTYNDEAALSYAIQCAYYSAEKYYTVIPELDSGKGFADIAYIPGSAYPAKPALIIELKYNKDAEGAISQIKRQCYPERLEHYKGNLLLVGIDYDPGKTNTDPDFKHHSCRIERA